MKALYIEEFAAKEIAQRSTFQSGEFEDAQNLIEFLREGKDFNVGNVSGTERKDIGYLVVANKANNLRSIIFDFDLAEDLLKLEDNDLMMVIQRVVKFSIKEWENLPHNVSEKIIKDNNAILFPFPYTDNNPLKVLVNLKPDEVYTSKRKMSCLYVAKFGIGNFQTSGYQVKNIKSIKKIADEICSKTRDTFTDKEGFNKVDSLHVTELEETQDNKADSLMSFSSWMHRLTKVQYDFVTGPLVGCERLEGAAGTGKTITLVLRALYLCDEFRKKNQDFHAIFLCHSIANKEHLKLLFQTTSSNPNILDREYSAQSIDLTTLQEWCTNYLGNKIGSSEVMDEDAQESKELQYKFVYDIYCETLEKDYPSYKILCSDEFNKFIDEKGKELVAQLLCSEISITIKGRASEDFETYKSLPRLQGSLPLKNEGDFNFVYLIYERYQNALNELGYFDNDDISLSSYGQLETPIWRRRRKELGYDAVFVDEIHLFNYNELAIFHLLTKDEKNNHLLFAVDKTQAIGDRGLTRESLADKLKVDEESSVHYNTIFRSSPQIIDLAFSILSSGAEVFNNFENPLKKILYAFSSEEEKKSTMPVYILKQTDTEMLEETFKQVDNLASKLSCGKDKILITCTDYEILNSLKKKSAAEHKPIEILHRRGDYQVIKDAEKNNRYVLGYIDYIGGLEFDGVVIVGVDKGRVPQNEDGQSNIYTSYEWYNRMYVAITRAKYSLVLIGNKSRDISPMLANAKANGRIKVKE